MGLVYRMLEECWGHREGYVFFPLKKDGRWYETGATEWPLKIESLSVHPDTYDIYFSPLVFSEPRRRKEHALPTHVLWADLDEADPEQCALRPSAAWQTTQGGFFGGSAPDGEDVTDEVEVKPRWQALWFLADGFTRESNTYWDGNGVPHIDAGPPEPTRTYIPADDAAQLSRRIAYAEGADKSGWDVTQVLRLPGTYNHKHTPPQKINLLWAERRYYTVAQIEAAYPSVPEAATKGVSPLPAATKYLADEALKSLPMGLQMALERPAGGDRSLEIMKLAEGLVRFGVDTAVALALLERSPLVQSKYGGRRDMRARLLTELSNAFMVVHKQEVQ